MLRSLITTQGSILVPSFSYKPFCFLKNDPYTNFLWKSLKKGSFITKTKKLENFKTRFLK
jgi:hypothetical protein